MSDMDGERKQINVRLNPTAERQLEQLSQKLNNTKSAIILQAIALLYSQHFPPPSA